MNGRSGISIGRIFGINIRIDWSWIFIFVLVSWSLSVLFGQYHSSWSLGARWGLAIAASLLFFGSVLLHELAHSLVARSRGIPVRSITLFLFGGVSDIQQEPKSAGTEFVMAIVGPLTSIVIGVVLTLIGGTALIGTSGVSTTATQTIGRLGPGGTIIVWLGSVNLIVGVFNLIPGFPLDGGRVLRSILWAITNNLRRATRWATIVAHGVAWIFIIGGIAMVFGVTIPFFGTGLIGGLWLAFIGWFLNSAASQSYNQVVIHDILGGVPVERIMRTNPPSVPSSSSVASLVHDHIMGSDDHSFPVMDDGQFRGLVTLQDVRNLSRDEWDTTNVTQIMTAADQLVTVKPQDDASDAWDKLTQRDVGQLPVIDNGKLAGLLRRQDIIKWLQIHAQSARAV